MSNNIYIHQRGEIKRRQVERHQEVLSGKTRRKNMDTNRSNESGLCTMHES